MPKYGNYINELKYCASKHLGERNTHFGCRSTYDLCMDTAVLLERLENAIIIPRGATNGDVIKTMFPNVECRKDILGNVFVISSAQLGHIIFRESWWNSPYKKERED